MRVSIAPLLEKRGATIQVKETLSCPPLDDFGGAAAGPVEVELSLTNTGESVLVTGVLRFSVALLCTRCLHTFVRRIATEIEDEFLLQATEEQSAADVYFGQQAPRISGDCLELGDLIEESLVLAIPMKAVCSQDCRGLCTMCGQPLDRQECHCSVETGDPRLAVLADLLEKPDRQ